MYAAKAFSAKNSINGFTDAVQTQYSLLSELLAEFKFAAVAMQVFLVIRSLLVGTDYKIEFVLQIHEHFGNAFWQCKTPALSFPHEISQRILFLLFIFIFIFWYMYNAFNSQTVSPDHLT